jgi:hypothetical protein
VIFLKTGRIGVNPQKMKFLSKNEIFIEKFSQNVEEGHFPCGKIKEEVI